MLTLLAILALFPAAQPAPGGNVELERMFALRSHAVHLDSIDPDDDDFGDLMALKARIGNARVVMLGEPSHGDGAAFLAKSRLARFLHAEMGFDVLAFESGMYDCRRVHEGMRELDDWREAVKRGIFGIWAESEQCRALFEYIHRSQRTARPLEIAGVDSQFTFDLGRSPFFDEVEAFFVRADLRLITGAQADLLTRLKVWHMERPMLRRRPGEDDPRLTDEQREYLRRVREAEAQDVAAYLRNIDELIAVIDADLAGPRRLLTVHSWRDAAFMRQCLNNLRAFTLQMSGESGNLRDIAMGETLAYLAREHYEGRKIMVWAATVHCARNLEPIEFPANPGAYEGVVTMGDAAVLGDTVYTIGFTSFDGHVGRPWTDASPIPVAEKGAFEAAMKATGMKLAFVDFKGLSEDSGPPWLRERINARPFGYAPMIARWGDHLDALIYIETMTPSTRVGAPPEPPPEGRRPGF